MPDACVVGVSCIFRGCRFCEYCPWICCNRCIVFLCVWISGITDHVW